MSSKPITVLILCLAAFQVKAASNDDVMELIDTLLKRDELEVKDIARQMEVYTQLEEVWANSNQASQLFCNYSVSTGEDVPVTVTWKVGDGPRFAEELLRCHGYTHSSNRCDRMEVVHTDYIGRARIAQETPSLEITNVIYSDNRNYWCQAAIEDDTTTELGFDMKSVVLRITNGPNTPKFHSLEIDEDFAASATNEVTIDCNCGAGYHCDDVFWYKGPVDSSYSNYDLVYSRTSYTRPMPTVYQAYNQWIDRAHLSGDSLVISNVTMEDSGRYWCELRSSGFYAIGEYATDARSVVLQVTPFATRDIEPFDCLGKDDGLYLDPLACTMYHECFDGRHFFRHCASGTVFNAELQRCDFPASVAPPCGTKPES